jgi:hypothetical protein
MTKTRQILSAIAIGGVIGAGLAQTAIARADEGTFVNQLDAHDVTVTSASIALGHTICAKISTDGYDGVTESVKSMLLADMSSHDAAAFVVFAGHELCPSTIPAIVAWMSRN